MTLLIKIVPFIIHNGASNLFNFIYIESNNFTVILNTDIPITEWCDNWWNYLIYYINKWGCFNKLM